MYLDIFVYKDVADYDPLKLNVGNPHMIPHSFPFVCFGLVQVKAT